MPIITIDTSDYKWPDDPEEKIRQASEIAKAVVEEFGAFLIEYHTALTRPKVGTGGYVEPPTNDPGKVSEVHRLRMACDHFRNSLNGIW
jgi:hypothetical protein